MHTLKAVEFVDDEVNWLEPVGAQADTLTPEDYIGAPIDPIRAFAVSVIRHMNADHSTSIAAMVRHLAGLPLVEKAEMVQLDRFGFTSRVTQAGQTFTLRLSFPRVALDRKDLKALIVEMTRTSVAKVAM